MDYYPTNSGDINEYLSNVTIGNRTTTTNLNVSGQFVYQGIIQNPNQQSPIIARIGENETPQIKGDPRIASMSYNNGVYLLTFSPVLSSVTPIVLLTPLAGQTNPISDQYTVTYSVPSTANIQVYSQLNNNPSVTGFNITIYDI